jgi:hypothetical protein
MDALVIVPAVAVAFGGTYYLGKVCLTWFVGSLEQRRGPGSAAAKRTEVASSERSAAGTRLE